MALSQEHRSALYDHFVPQLGEDVTEALLAEFPADEGDELVTKTFLRAELAEFRGELRAELHQQLGGLRTEVGELRGELRTELHQQVGGLRAEVHQLHNRTITTLIGAMGVMTAILAVVD